MSQKDIRWEQRFSNYRKALAKMEEVVSHEKVNELSELEKEGLIQRFEYTYELAWKTLQDLLRHKGYTDIAHAGASVPLVPSTQQGHLSTHPHPPGFDTIFLRSAQKITQPDTTGCLVCKSS